MCRNSFSLCLNTLRCLMDNTVFYWFKICNCIPPIGRNLHFQHSITIKRTVDELDFLGDKYAANHCITLILILLNTPTQSGSQANLVNSHQTVGQILLYSSKPSTLFKQLLVASWQANKQHQQQYANKTHHSDTYAVRQQTGSSS